MAESVTEKKREVEGSTTVSTTESAGDCDSPSPLTGGAKKSRSDKWLEKFHLLKSFHSRHGHCRVPKSRPGPDRLGAWVSYQRRSYWDRVAGKPSPMTDERVALLGGIGFEWRAKRRGVERGGDEKEDVAAAATADREVETSTTALTAAADDVGSPPPPPPSTSAKKKSCSDTWLEKFRLLESYDRRSGHCRVPQRSRPGDSESDSDPARLGPWVAYQRRSYWDRVAGKPSPMTDERVALLEGIEFEWRMRTKRGGEEEEDGAAAAETGAEGEALLGREWAEATAKKRWETEERDAKWRRTFEELRAHVEASGDFSGTTGYLGRWMYRQRRSYGVLLEGRKSCITPEKIRLLEGIGFEWGWNEGGSNNDTDAEAESGVGGGDGSSPTTTETTPASGPTTDTIVTPPASGGESRIPAARRTSHRPKKQERLWAEHLDELVRYRSKHGHCRIPHDHPTNLGVWLVLQRRAYRKMRDGKKSPMTPDRIEKLEAVDGFQWEPPRGRSKRTDKMWMGRYEELKTFVEEHGHFRAPDSGPLSGWMTRQRQYYRRRKDQGGAKQVKGGGDGGKGGDPLPDDRVHLLNSIGAGFPWETTGAPARSVKWNTSLEELKRYKAANGDTNVPFQRRRTKVGGAVDAGETTPTTSESDGEQGPQDSNEEKADDDNVKGDKVQPANVMLNPLGTWVAKQRSDYARWKKGEKNSMNGDKVIALEAIGFRWALRDPASAGPLQRAATLCHPKKMKASPSKKKEAIVPVPALEAGGSDSLSPMVGEVGDSSGDVGEAPQVDACSDEPEVSRGLKLASETAQVSEPHALGIEHDDASDVATREIELDPENDFGDGEGVGTESLRGTDLGCSFEEGTGEAERAPTLLSGSAASGSVEVHCDTDEGEIDHTAEIGKRPGEKEVVQIAQDEGARKSASKNTEKRTVSQSASEQQEHCPARGELPHPTKKRQRTVDKKVTNTNKPESSGTLAEKRAKKREMHWLERFKEVRKIHAEKGHCRGITRSTFPGGLGLWAAQQRRAYLDRAEGKDSTLTDERMRKLAALNFEWVATGKRGDDQWVASFEELRAYRTQYGHCNVTRTENKTLGNWVRQQRELYRGGSNRGSLSDERKNLLTSLEFKWGYQIKEARAEQNQSSWHENLQAFVAFCSEHGCPPKKGGPLGNWVCNQRKARRNRIEGKKPCLSEERMRLLDEIQFDWGVKKIGAGKTWEERFIEIANFQQAQGHCNIPTKQGDPLSRWVTNQRQNYRRTSEGQKVWISDERIALLNGIGFQWTMKSSQK